MASASSSIRAYVPADASVVLVLIQTVLGEFGFALETGGLLKDLASDAYQGANAGLWVAEVDGVVAGTVGIRPKSDGACELKRLYVRSELRGHGLGRALYAHAEGFARSAGYDSIWLDSSRRFTAARRLYEANGFVIVESVDNDWEDNVYQKRLT